MCSESSPPGVYSESNITPSLDVAPKAEPEQATISDTKPSGIVEPSHPTGQDVPSDLKIENLRNYGKTRRAVVLATLFASVAPVLLSQGLTRFL